MATINELRISSGGDSDNTSNFFELHGAPGESLDGLSLLVVAAEEFRETTAGTIQFVFDLTGGQMDDSGVFLLSNPGEYANDAGDLNASFDIPGAPFNILLVEGFTGTVNDDLDIANDGTFDTTPWTRIVDSVSLVDGDDTTDTTYSATVMGPDGSFAPAALARTPDGTGDFGLVAFGDVDLDTPGELNASADGVFTLELLHVADQEAGSAAVSDAPRMSAVLNALRAQDLGNDGQPDNTVTLSSGDAFIPGLFYDASGAAFGAAGIADIQIQNEMGFQAIALGNHEFDFNTRTLSELITGEDRTDDSEDDFVDTVPQPIGDFTALTESALAGQTFTGADFPYLSANLDFSTDPFLADLEVDGGQAPQANSVSSSTVIDVNGELLGVVGATTPTLAAISSPGSVGIAPVWAGTTPTTDELDALAAEIQAEVDSLLAANPTMNKVVLLAHMQQLSIELALAERLENVDIIVGGGSNTRLFDENDRIRDGDVSQGTYPQVVTNAGGTDTLVVNTDGSYQYVGRLVIDFDADGNIIAESYDATVSGAYATDAQGVADLGAEALVDPEVQAIADAIEDQIIATEGNVFGYSEVFLNGNRSGTGEADDTDGVRTQETNLGNLTADANLAAAQAVNANVVLSIKNGGGIRASIGETIVPPGGSEAVRTANSEVVDGEGNVVKAEGGISQNDIQTSLAFNNDLVVLTLTTEEIVALLEHGVAALPGVSGRFPQVSGVEFSYDVDLPAGSRILDAQIVDAEGTTIATLVENGETVVSDATFDIVTLGFLAAPRFDNDGNFTGGGDGYPFPNTNTDPEAGEVGADAARINLTSLLVENDFSGDATFAETGSEQDALAEYLQDTYGTPETAYAMEDGALGEDTRIIDVDAAEALVEDSVNVAGSGEIRLERIAAFDSGAGEGGSEVVAYDTDAARMYTTNGAQDRIDVTDLSDPENPVALGSVDLSGAVENYAGIQSVAVNGTIGVAAVAREDDAGEPLPGVVVAFDLETLEIEGTAEVGFLPDMVTFTPDGSRILVANEGEPGAADVPGSVSIIDAETGDVRTLGFEAFDLVADDLREAGVRIFPDGEGGYRLPSLDFEPEYISVAPDGSRAFVTLQEANAVAVLDLTYDAFVAVLPLGTVDHSLPGNELDASDRDDAINIANAPLRGMHMPDAIASFQMDGETYFVTANEGDARDSAGSEERVKDVTLDAVAFPNADALQEDEVIGRINVSTFDGDTDGDGDQDALFSYGTRSFSIFNAAGERVFDSGSQFETIIANVRPANAFNNDDFPSDAPDVLDENRSDNKGPEPEAVAIGQIGEEVYAFIGLERDSGIMVYRVTDPANAEFVQYINTVDQGDVSPETLVFVSAEDSPSGAPLLLAANEVSGTTSIFEIDVDPLPTAMPNGVASGEITQTSALLWARSVNEGTLTFEVATDMDFADVVATATVEVTDPDGPVRSTITGLTAGTEYFYRAVDAEGAVVEGTFDTAAAEGTRAGLTFGATGDWRGDGAPYVAVSNAADAGLDFMMLEGDTIYADYPSEDLPFEQAQTQEEFRLRYQEVYGEAQGENFWADLRGSTAIFASIDDHEVTNDFSGGADASTDDRFVETEGFINDTALYETGLAAWQEYHPVESRTYGDTGDDRTAGEIDLYRTQSFGSDASIFVLDNRSFRDAPLADPTGGSDEVIGQFVAQSLTEDRTMLGDAQLTRLQADLLAAEEAGQTWKFIFNAEPIQNLGPVGPADRYEGYARERAELLSFIEENNIDNVVFVAADVHGTFVNNLTYQTAPFGEQIATSAFEVTTGSVGFSPAFGESLMLGALQVGAIDQATFDFYNSLPVAPDNNGQADDRDGLVTQLLNDIALTPLGYDPLGLDDNLDQADGLISAQLLQGGWVSAHTFGWTEFDVDEVTQELTVTTWGIEDYTPEEMRDTPEEILDREPQIVSQFVVQAQDNTVSISAVQGAGHRSAFDGVAIAVEGIVTAIDEGEGFYVQDPEGDGNAATSDGIYVDGAADVAVGDMVRVSGTVDERQFGDDLSVTILDDVTDVRVRSSGNALPEAIVLGSEGLLPPTGHIDDDGLEVFDPENDGIDFFESLEGMLVTVQDGARVIGSNRFGETFITVHGETGSESVNGGLVLGGANGAITDANPERILIDDDIYADSGRGEAREAVPAAVTGDTVTGVTGVMDYSFGEFKLLATSAPTVVRGDVQRETTTLTATQDGQLTMATYNVLNLAGDAADDRFTNLAQDIVTNLGAPTILGLQEIQDNNGATNDGTVDASETYERLIAAITAAGGPTYAYADSTPTDLADGGQPGANIRVGVLYDPAAVSLVSTLRIEGDLDPNGAFDEDATPGDGVNEGYAGTRKPLVANFDVDGEALTVIVTHFKSKSGDTPLSGEVQPFEQVTVAQRTAQAQVVNDYVAGLLAADPNANIAVMGDMNDFQFSAPVQALAGSELTNLSDMLAEEDAYSFIFNGNSQMLDHILVSNALAQTAEVDAVHLNVDFPSAEVESDHDPIVARFDLSQPAELVFGSANSDTLGGDTGNNRFTPGAGLDRMNLGAGGADTIAGSQGDLDGDVVQGFGEDDVFTFNGLRVRGAVLDDVLLRLDLGGDVFEEVILPELNIDGHSLMVVRGATDSTVQAVRQRGTLEEGASVADGDVNGIAVDGFLAGTNGQSFQVELDEAGAGFSNALGYFTRDIATGAIEDVAMLFDNAKAAGTGATASIADVSVDEELGFFLVRNGASLVDDITGTLGLVETGGRLYLSEDGAALTSSVLFNSLDVALNADGLQHVLSGATEDGQGLRIGFEDKLGGGDRDYQDVTFTVTVLDDTLLV